MADEAVFQVRVTPRAARDAVVGWRDGVLLVRLRALPVEGQANESLRRFLAERLNLPPRNVDIVSGATSRTKRLRVTGLTLSEVEGRLAG